MARHLLLDVKFKDDGDTQQPLYVLEQQVDKRKTHRVATIYACNSYLLIEVLQGLIRASPFDKRFDNDIDARYFARGIHAVKHGKS